jgi:hypothetical protein
MVFDGAFKKVVDADAPPSPAWRIQAGFSPRCCTSRGAAHLLHPRQPHQRPPGRQAPGDRSTQPRMEGQPRKPVTTGYSHGPARSIARPSAAPSRRTDLAPPSRRPHPPEVAAEAAGHRTSQARGPAQIRRGKVLAAARSHNRHGCPSLPPSPSALSRGGVEQPRRPACSQEAQLEVDRRAPPRVR